MMIRRKINWREIKRGREISREAIIEVTVLERLSEKDGSKRADSRGVYFKEWLIESIIKDELLGREIKKRL